MTDPAALSYLRAMVRDERDLQREIVRARNYHAGHQPVEITDRLRAFLGMGTAATEYVPFVMNVARIVTSALTERLIVQGIDTDEEPGADGEKAQAALAWSWWQRNRMDARADEAQLMAIRDGEAFVLVDWDAAAGRPRFTPHPRYTDGDPMVGGDGYGMIAVYEDDDDSAPMAYAVKRWQSVRYVDGRRITAQRMTRYYADRIERYVQRGGQWEPYAEDGAAPVQPWRDAAGRPLGVPAIHLKNAGLRPEAFSAWPLQDAINKTLIDLIAAADVSAFRILAAFGWVPTTDGRPPAEDGSNALYLQPGMIVGSTNPDGSLAAIEGSDLGGLLALLGDLVQRVAMVTDTPLSRFLATRQVAAEGTLKQQEAPLLAKVRNRQVLLGNAWEDAFTVARRVANAYGRAGLDEGPLFSAVWAPAETRDAKAELEAATLKKALGVPEYELWAELGYPQQKIAQWREEADARRAEMQRMMTQEVAPDASDAAPAPNAG